MLKKSFFGRKLASGFQDIHYSCVVNFLDAREPLTVTFQKETLGRSLIDHVCSSLDLAEKDYFGLRYVDKEKQRHWLDLKKPAYRQLKGAVPMALCFRVKYYPSDPFKLKEEITRYYLFLQLERDLLHGRLLCTQDELTTLTAYLLQAKLGDFDEEKMTKEELIKTNLLPKGADLDKIITVYKKIGCLPVVAAEETFVKESSKIDTYGVDPHPVKDLDGNAMYVGLSHPGVMTFKGNKKANCFSWNDISRIDFEGKTFIIHVLSNEIKDMKKKKQVYSFKCPSTSACKHLWKCAVEQQGFFTLDSGEYAPKVRGNKRLFRRSSTFKFSGLSESEIWLSTTSLNREEPVVQRSVSNPQFFRSTQGYETLPASFKIGAYQLASGDSLESSSSSSLMIASKANINTLNHEEPVQKSPPHNLFENIPSIEIEEEKIVRNNLEEVPEDEVEEVTEEVISQDESTPKEPNHPILDGILKMEMEIDVPATENFKHCDSSFFPLVVEASNSEFFDPMYEDHKVNPLPFEDLHVKRSSSKNFYIYLFIILFLVSMFVYLISPDQRSFLYSCPGQAVDFAKNILCQIGF